MLPNEILMEIYADTPPGKRYINLIGTTICCEFRLEQFQQIMSTLPANLQTRIFSNPGVPRDVVYFISIEGLPRKFKIVSM